MALKLPRGAARPGDIEVTLTAVGSAACSEIQRSSSAGRTRSRLHKRAARSSPRAIARSTARRERPQARATSSGERSASRFVSSSRRRTFHLHLSLKRAECVGSLRARRRVSGIRVCPVRRRSEDPLPSAARGERQRRRCRRAGHEPVPTPRPPPDRQAFPPGAAAIDTVNLPLHQSTENDADRDRTRGSAEFGPDGVCDVDPPMWSRSPDPSDPEGLLLA